MPGNVWRRFSGCSTTSVGSGFVQFRNMSLRGKLCYGVGMSCWTSFHWNALALEYLAGTTDALWFCIQNAQKRSSQTRNVRHRQQRRLGSERVREGTRSSAAFHMVQERFLWDDGNPLDAGFAALVLSFEHSRCLYIHDHVYALLSFEPSAAESIEPDYTQSALQLFRRVAV